MKRILPLLLLLASCRSAGNVPPLPSDPADYRPLPKYAAMEIPADNPMTPQKAHLGRQLFFDARLSGDGSRSCYSCHLNDKGLTDGMPTAVGAFNKTLTRNSPTLWNIGYHAEFYWDGRSKGLEAQAMAAWKGPNMGAGDAIPAIVEKLNGIAGYKKQFDSVFGAPATPDTVCKALACYMRTIVSRDTPFDRWQDGDESAVSEAAKRGHTVFLVAKCDNCHAGKLFTSQQSYNVGIGMNKEPFDVGRFAVTKEEKHKGAFKAPTLRDVADSAPYFHDGSVATLAEAVEMMAAGGVPNPYLDQANIKPAELSAQQLSDLIEFLKSLDEPGQLEVPTLPE